MKGLLFLLSLSTYVYSSVDNYIFPYSDPSFSSYGTTGLLQMPNARLFEAGDVGINYASFNPYNRISVVASPFFLGYKRLIPIPRLRTDYIQITMNLVAIKHLKIRDLI